MAGDGKNRWIVLLNKSPKGPFSENEILALLEGSVLRRNDIAYLLPDSNDPKARTEWKLLWQFPEFNRRGDALPHTKSAPVERRSEPVTHVPKNLDEVPADLLDIQLEDLIPRSSKIGITEQKDSAEAQETIPAPRPNLSEMEASSRNQWIFGSVGMVLVATVCWILYPSFVGTSIKQSSAAPMSVERLPAAGGTGVGIRPPSPAPAAAAAAAAPIASRRMPEDAPLATHSEPEVMEANQGEPQEEEAQENVFTDEQDGLGEVPKPVANAKNNAPMGAGKRQIGSMPKPNATIGEDRDAPAAAESEETTAEGEE